MTISTQAARITAKVALYSGRPIAQAAVILFCIAWLAAGSEENRLTLALSILAITLSQMVLGSQELREKEALRRDNALHAKIDELVHATEGARDDLVHLEEADEAAIQEKRL